MVVLYHVVALPVLPYPYDGLEPWLSRESVRLHRVLHERYVARTNTIIRGTPLEGQAVEWVVAAGIEQWELDGNPTLYEQAAQVANHDFFWRCLKPNGGDVSRNIPKRLRRELPAAQGNAECRAASGDPDPGHRLVGACVLEQLPDAARGVGRGVPVLARRLGHRRGATQPGTPPCSSPLT